jgi:hypothetical protein
MHATAGCDRGTSHRHIELSGLKAGASSLEQTGYLQKEYGDKANNFCKRSCCHDLMGNYISLSSTVPPCAS